MERTHINLNTLLRNSKKFESLLYGQNASPYEIVRIFGIRKIDLNTGISLDETPLFRNLLKDGEHILGIARYSLLMREMERLLLKLDDAVSAHDQRMDFENKPKLIVLDQNFIKEHLGGMPYSTKSTRKLSDRLNLPETKDELRLIDEGFNKVKTFLDLIRYSGQCGGIHFDLYDHTPPLHTLKKHGFHKYDFKDGTVIAPDEDSSAFN